MKSSTNGGAAPDVASWLKTLPLAPEYRPTHLEFQDPIAYILKIEKEASQFGICKIVPPLPTATKRSTVSNLNHSFAARNPDDTPTFTTRQQQIGFCPRRPRPVQKPVWQSGERYTLTQFESKAKQFEREQLKKTGKKSLTPLEVETLFWRACAGKPFSVEYANDMPGSGFPPIGGDGLKEAGNVGESGWNMRTVSRARCSLLRFMKDDIPGVTSPMVYVAMMFSWFAWHVEDHDLHSLNYLHMGAGKTWYGVPRDACSAFEDVIRVQGYCEEVNPLVTFAILGEKTTVISPEVLIGAGIPCCRLVQNAGEFVVTFPGSYHSGFSHGFNCGEASNIATPEWLKVAKEAAVKRASTNYPPMVSHFQLLYALAVSLCSRMPTDNCNEPRSSRLKYKMKGEGEAIVKGFFVENVIQNNNLLALLLDKGSSCIVLSQNTSNSHLGSGSLARSQMTVKPRLSLGLCSHQEAVEASEVLFSNYAIPERNGGIRQLAGFYPMKVNPISVCQEKKLLSAKCSKFGNVNFHPSNMENMEGGKGSTFQGDELLDKGLLSCATCGILSFACVAVIQPREAAARYLMSADCSVFNDSVIESGEVNDLCNVSNMFSVPEHMERHVQSRSDGNLADCNTQSIEASAQNVQLISDSAIPKGISALDLLASAYGDYSDSEEEELVGMPACSDDKDSRDTAQSVQPRSISSPNICSSNIVPNETDSHLVGVDCQNIATGSSRIPSKLVSSSTVPTKISCLLDVAANLHNLASISTEEKQLKMEFLAGNLPGNPESAVINNLDADTKMGLSCLTQSTKDRHSFDGSSTEPDSACYSTEISDTSETKMANPMSGSADFLISSGSCCDSDSPTGITAAVTQDFNFDTSVKNSSISVLQRSNNDSSRMHVFCLEHAVEVERQLHPVGGVHIMLVCHPGYPKIEAEAKVLAKELGMDHFWKDIPYQEATKEDQRTIQSALQDEEDVPMKGDWSVKLGINLYYSANLSKSPIYSKQLPYNLVIYKAFGRNSTSSSLGKPSGPSKRRRIAVAGRWCGKVWMSNQVHPYLAHRNDIQNDDDEHGTDQKLLAETDIELTDFVSSSRRNLSNSTKSGRKRKMKVLLKLSDKRPRFANLDSSDCIAEVSECSSPQGGRVPCKQAAGRNSAPEEVEDKPTLRKPVVGKRTNKVQATVRVREDEDPEYQCDMEGRSMGFGSKRTKKVQPTTRVHEDEDTEYQRDMEGRSMRFGSKKTKKVQPTTRVHEDEDTEFQCDMEGRGTSVGLKKTKKVQPTTHVHEDEDTEYQCDIEGRGTSFGSKKTKKVQRTTRVHEDEDTEYQCDIKGRGTSVGSKKTKKVQPTTRVHEDEDTEYQCDMEGRGTTVGSKKTKKVQPTTRVPEDGDAEYPCDMEGCIMSFGSKQDLVLHKCNICPEKDCRKKFFSHKYLVQHRKVHLDDRPLKCPWKGCKMAFKWPWARTEHIRVHTGDRPYICQEAGCDQTFRFVSDFSRHKRKTGHKTKKARR